MCGSKLERNDYYNKHKAPFCIFKCPECDFIGIYDEKINVFRRLIQSI